MLRLLLILSLIFFALPANADGDRRYKKDRREYRDNTYYCEYHRGQRYCYLQEDKRRYKRYQETKCVWVDYKNFGMWVCDQEHRDYRYGRNYYERY